jgi:hypothetical protein
LGGRGRRISEFEASLVYKVSSRTARAIKRNPVSKNQKKKKKRKKKKKNPAHRQGCRDTQQLRAFTLNLKVWFIASTLGTHNCL